MAIISEAARPAFTIPTVDLRPYLANPTSSEAEDVVEQIRQACTTSGFFQITGHGISQELQERTFAAAKTVFALPDEDKRKLSGKPGRGYEIVGTQKLEAGKKADLKEVCNTDIAKAKSHVSRVISLAARCPTASHPSDLSRRPTFGHPSSQTPTSDNLCSITMKL